MSAVKQVLLTLKSSTTGGQVSSDFPPKEDVFDLVFDPSDLTIAVAPFIKEALRGILPHNTAVRVKQVSWPHNESVILKNDGSDNEIYYWSPSQNGWISIDQWLLPDIGRLRIDTEKRLNLVFKYQTPSAFS